VQIALATAVNHTWSIPLDSDTLAPQNFNAAKSVSWTSLIFDDSLGANANRSSNQLELYPVWRIGLVLNKWYGQMYGIEVDVWADNGQVRSVQEEYSTLPPPSGAPTANLSSQSSQASQATSSLALLFSLPIMAVALAGTGYFWVKKKELHCYSLLRRRGVKTAAILFCVLISSTAALDAMSTVNATTRDAVIWGARSIGATNEPYSTSWRKTDTEIYYQSITASDIAWDFSSNGYTAYDHEGADSTENQILNDIYDGSGGLQSSYDYGAFVDFNHGVIGYDPRANNEEHYMFEDDEGTKVGYYYDYTQEWYQAVYDTDIYNIVNPSQVVFAFINTCLSADTTYLGQGSNVYSSGNAVGMPYAFTHRLVEPNTQGFNVATQISNDGYDNPDTGSQIYIGFPTGSAGFNR